MTTSDNETTILQLRQEVQKFIDERQWGKYHTPKNLSESIAIEAAELMEIFQWINDNEMRAIAKDEDKVQQLKEELADVVIYSLSLANVMQIELSKAVMDKIEKNRQKYPVEKVRGNYIKYERR